MNYRKEIDGLRALAVIPVIFFHAGFETFSGGFVGVDVFFVISGYLITTIILVELEADKFSIVNFYERRARRILPALFFVMAACIPFAWIWLLPSDLNDFVKSLQYVSVFFSNFLFYKQSGYFDTAAEFKPLLHTWSLAVEEQYYMLFPLLLFVLWKFKKNIIPLSLFLLLTASLIYSEHKVGVDPDAAFFLLPSRFWELLIGASLAYVASRTKPLAENNIFADQSCSILGLILIIYSVLFFDRTTPFPSIYTLAPTIGTALILTFAKPTTLVGRLLSTKYFVGMGLISYSAYLWHQPLFAFRRYTSLYEPNTFTLLLLSFTAVTLAYLTWRYIEQPFRKKDKFNRKSILLLSTGISAAFILFGAYVRSENGFLSRYSASDRYLASINNATQGKYVNSKFKSLKLNNFPSDKRIRILVIGDSYAEDLINAIYETELPRYLSVSTYRISARCGNLFLEEDYTRHISEIDRWMCHKQKRYSDQVLRQRIREADEIWLSSAWRDWQALLISRSVSNLKKEFKKPVVVFGRKNFGTINRGAIIRMNTEDRIALLNTITAKHIAINDAMIKELNGDDFINVSELLCGSRTTCPIFNNDGRLISFDGDHLTKDGAKLLGQKLLEHPRISSLINKSSTHTPQ